MYFDKFKALGGRVIVHKTIQETLELDSDKIDNWRNLLDIQTSDSSKVINKKPVSYRYIIYVGELPIGDVDNMLEANTIIKAYVDQNKSKLDIRDLLIDLVNIGGNIIFIDKSDNEIAKLDKLDLRRIATCKHFNELVPNAVKYELLIPNKKKQIFTSIDLINAIRQYFNKKKCE